MEEQKKCTKSFKKEALCYEEHQNADISNIYRLDGQVPIMKAIPFGLQHILAMFVANLTPITIIAGAGGLKQAEIAILLQNAMFVAGIATLSQLTQSGKSLPPSYCNGSQFHLCNSTQYSCRQLQDILQLWAQSMSGGI